MDVNVERNILNLPDDEFAVDFETEKTAVRLGKSDRFFYMDFNDINFPARFKKGREDIGDFLEKKRVELGVDDFGELQPNNESIEEIDKIINLLGEVDSYVKGTIDYMFGYPISKDVFGCASCLSVTRKGEYYFDNFLNAVLPLIEREYQVRIKASNEKIRKYTDKKGMHPALKK